MASETSTSVVIVGGSIVGLSAALFLAAQQVPTILIERHKTSSRHPRAIGYTARTMELLRSVGLEASIPKISAGGPGGKPRRVKVESLAGKWYDESFFTKVTGVNGNHHGSPNGNGTSHQKLNGIARAAEVPSPCMMNALAQDIIEPIIRDKAIELGADLRLGCTMVSWTQDDDGVSVTVVDSQGAQFTVAGKYLLACDGAQSSIRQDLGIPMHGVGHLKGIRSILFRCPSMKKVLASGVRQFNIKNDNVEALLMSYPDGRWCLIRSDDVVEKEDEATQMVVIRHAAGEEVEDIELITTGNWDFAGYTADHFAVGRVFLAGDSAHVLPPSRGGYGANNGIADVHNLAWKLAAVLDGTSATSLLETYEAERRPVALLLHDQLFARDDYKDQANSVGWRDSVPPRARVILDEVAIELGQLYRSSAVLADFPVEDDGYIYARRPEEWAGQPGTRAPHLPMVRLAKRGGNGEEEAGEEAISSLDLLPARTWVVLSEDVTGRWALATRKAAVDLGIGCGFVRISTDARAARDGAFGESFGVGPDGAVLVRPDGFIAWRSDDDGSGDDKGCRDLVEALARVSHATKRSGGLSLF